VTDSVLVRAPVGVAYQVLTDLDGWPRWLDGCRSVRLAPDPTLGPSDRHALVLPGVRRPSRIQVASYGWRHDVGMRWDVSLRGRAPTSASVEWWLEDRREGVVVHHLVHQPVHDPEGAPSGGKRGDRAVLRYRRSVTLALQALKDHLELAVAHAAGRVP
jgi:uncharacterized protein YndB with AHSA1/START domain